MQSLYSVSCQSKNGTMPCDYNVYWFGLIPRDEADRAFVNLVERVKRGLDVPTIGINGYPDGYSYTISTVMMHRTFDHGDTFEKVSEWSKPDGES